MKRKDDRVVIHFVRPRVKLPRHISQPSPLPGPQSRTLCLRNPSHRSYFNYFHRTFSRASARQGEDIVRANDGFRACPCFRRAEH
jgi:hypothetical protein